MKHRLLLIILVAALFTRAYPHSGNPAFHVIIDTDGALDDMRAITMLLSCNDVRVLAITCSDGTLVLTNEIHGHTGIYSIIGAKMGIRAMEYFNVGVNSLVVESFAGDAPPLSCFNDGIQISTGATIGQGLIHVSDSVSAVPSAVFQCNQLKVHISVREELAERMEQEIAYGERTYGILTDAYWLYIERLAQTYWAELDRNEIFRIYVPH